MKRPELHKNVKTLGWVSFLTDASSEMLYPVIPFFLTVTLGAPAAVLGLMEGLAEALSALIKGTSGPLSDYFRRRKPFVFSGYTLSSISKLVLAISPIWGFALCARVFERVGKGIRTPARDALIAEVTSPASRGRAFGFHRAMDTWGAVLGASAAFLLLSYLEAGFRTVMLIALAPAFLGVVATLRIEERPASSYKEGGLVLASLLSPPSSPAYRKFVIVYAVFSIGASSATFLILWARSIGFSYAGSLLPYIFANIIYAAASERAGRLSDSLGRKNVLLGGMVLFSVSYATIFFFPSRSLLFAALALYGLFMAATEGIGKAFVTDLVEAADYGRALGFFHLITGTSALLSSVAAGILWDKVSPRAPFLQGALFGITGALLLAALLGAGNAEKTASCPEAKKANPPVTRRTHRTPE